MVIDKPMRWAVEATARLGLLPKFPRDALAIQRAAAPLLAVVRACLHQGSRCVLCGLPVTGLPPDIHDTDCPMPAALKAMESADAEARPS